MGVLEAFDFNNFISKVIVCLLFFQLNHLDFFLAWRSIVFVKLHLFMFFVFDFQIDFPTDQIQFECHVWISKNSVQWLLPF